MRCRCGQILVDEHRDAASQRALRWTFRAGDDDGAMHVPGLEEAAPQRWQGGAHLRRRLERRVEETGQLREIVRSDQS